LSHNCNTAASFFWGEIN